MNYVSRQLYLNTAFVEGLRCHTFRTVCRMSHQSVSPQSLPGLTEIMSAGTLGLCLREEPVAAQFLLLQHFSAIQWKPIRVIVGMLLLGRDSNNNLSSI